MLYLDKLNLILIMKKQRLKLQNLTVYSFKTNSQETVRTVMGGGVSNGTLCANECEDCESGGTNTGTGGTGPFTFEFRTCVVSC